MRACAPLSSLRVIQSQFMHAARSKRGLNMHTISLRLLIVAAAGAAMFAGQSAAPARAADFGGYGGDCCADLEERIAELEETTARKGNRKVSLQISGWVNEALFFWDDGYESNVYVGTNSQEQSRFKVKGKAKITSDIEAGYTLEIGVNGGKSSDFDQDTTADKAALTLRKSSWYLKSKTYGKVTVGRDGASTYHLVDNVINPVANTRYYADFESAAVGLAKFNTRFANGGGYTGFEWEELMGGFNNETPGQNSRRNLVKYDSPTFAGFAFSASWGEDDFWDTRVTFEGERGPFIVSAAVGYGESSDEAGKFNCNGFSNDCEWWGASVAAKHKPTGLYGWFGYGGNEVDDLAATQEDTSHTYYVQAGIEQRWNALGTTTIFGEYRKDDVGATSKVFGSDLDHYGAGIVQNIDAAAMDVYAIYRRSDGDYQAAMGGPDIELEEFDLLIMGGRIKF